MAISLESITQPKNLPLGIILYGPPGWGKTEICLQSLKNVMLPTENGFGNRDLTNIKAFPVTITLREVHEAIDSLIEGTHDFKTLCIDTLSNLQKLILDEALRSYNLTAKTPIKNPDEALFRAVHKQAANLWPPILAKLDRLRSEKRMMIILTAHSRIDTIDPPDADKYDKFVIDVDKDALPILTKWADIILFGSRISRFRKVGQGIMEQKKGIAGAEEDPRIVYTEDRTTHLAKNRERLPYEILMEDGKQFQTIFNLIYPPKDAKETKEPTI